MIPVLRSIDSLLNRFDELSQRHTNLVSEFDTNFTNIENPLHDISRDENERRKTSENLLKMNIDTDNPYESCEAILDFNQRVTKTRYQNRPPSYLSNDSSLLYNRALSRGSWATTESAPAPRTSAAAAIQMTLKTSISQTVPTTSIEDLIDPRPRMTTKMKPKVSPPDPFLMRRNQHSTITKFTLETAIRLSRPKTYHHSPVQQISSKRVHRRPRPFQSPKKEPPQPSNPSSSVPSSSPPQIPPPPVESSPPPPTVPPKIKRMNPTIIKSSPKKLKADNKLPTDNSKRIPMTNYPKPAIFLSAPPTISLTFPMQPELKSSRVVVIPKANPVVPVSKNKAVNILTNKRTIIPSKRLLYLMT